MAVEVKLQFDEAYISQFSKNANEPQWLLDLRLSALKLAYELPMVKPEKTKIDRWNFTAFHHTSFAKPVEDKNELPSHLQSLFDEEHGANNVLVHQNGVLVYAKLADELKAKGVIFTDMKTAVKEHSDLVQKYYMKDGVKIDEHRLTALHAALMNSGTFLYVPKNVDITVPMQSVYYIDDPDFGFINHVLIVAEDNSSVNIVENYASSEKASSVANIVVEAIAGQNAKIVYGSVDEFSKDMTTYVNRRGVVSRDGKILFALGQMNDGNTLSDNTTYLNGDNAYTETKTVSVGRGEQKQNFVSQVFHFGKGSESFIVSHGVMKDSASSIFNGITKIEHGASKSNGEQTERVLMLSEKARGDANPILLIDEDDVMAGHAASVGRVDEGQLYYMMSRGIKRHEAERLIIHGFLDPVVRELPIEGVKKRLVDVIERKVR